MSISETDILTLTERMIIHRLADAVRDFVSLPIQDPSDAAAFTEAIHRAQHLVMKRVAQRIHPEIFGEVET